MRTFQVDAKSAMRRAVRTATRAGVAGLVTAGALIMVTPPIATAAGPLWAPPVPSAFGPGVEYTASPFSELVSVSCASPGNCTAAGRFNGAGDDYQAFTQTSTAGVWAQAVPATFPDGVENANSISGFEAVSCASAGNCTAAGYFRDINGNTQAFTQTSTAGVWGEAVPVTFAAGSVSASPYAIVGGVSCASAGNCTVAGRFRDVNGNTQAFTQTSVAGVWGEAVPARFAAGVQNATPDDYFTSVSCASAGSCTAVGKVYDSGGDYQAFTQTSVAGVWAEAVLATFATGVQYSDPNDGFVSISCASAGNCTAAGSFVAASGDERPFTQTSTGGVWAPPVPATFPAGIPLSYGYFSHVSCASAGNCVAVGNFNVTTDGFNRAFTQASTGGVWATAAPVTFAVGVQTSDPNDTLSAVSCASAGNCTAVGSFNEVDNNKRAFTQTSTQINVLPPTGSGTRLVWVGVAVATTGILLVMSRWRSRRAVTR